VREKSPRRHKKEELGRTERESRKRVDTKANRRLEKKKKISAYGKGNHTVAMD